jgi:glycosyltransferase involved in cell wall biosynthesis
MDSLMSSAHYLDIQGFPGGFTVLMAVYGKDDPDLFIRAISSVYGNDLKPDHTILVVDGPVPLRLEKKINFTQQRYGIEIVRLDKNCGLAAALNIGLQHIKTEWVVRADADDYNLPQRFRRIAELLHKQPDLDLIGSTILEIERDGTQVARRVMPTKQAQIYKLLSRRSPFNHMTIAFRRSLVEHCGGYPNIYLKEDYALWVIMISSGAKCANLDEVLVHVTAGRDMYRRRSGWRYAHAEIELQKIMVRCGIKSRFRAVVDGIGRASVFLAPAFFRCLIYEQILRYPVNKVNDAAGVSDKNN